MKNKELDRFFQEKLARHELSPSPDAWAQVSGELSERKRPIVWMRIAAAVVVLALSGVLIYQFFLHENTSSEKLVAGADYPPSIEGLEWTWNLQSNEQTTETVATDSIPMRKETNGFEEELLAEEVESLAEESTDDIELISPEISPIRELQMADLEVDDFDLLQLEDPLPEVTVRFTYIAHEEPTVEEPVDERSRMAKIIDKARDMTPGTMIASIRETRSELLNGF